MRTVRWACFALMVLTLTAGRGAAQEKSALVSVEDTARTGRGSITHTLEITSSILKQKRTVYVVTPPSFSSSAPDRRYPVAVVRDGEENVSTAASVSDELSRNGQKRRSTRSLRR